MNQVSSVAYFKPIWLSWRVMGLRKSEDVHWKRPYKFYRFFIFVVVTVLTPIHFCLALFSSSTIAMNLKSISISATITTCSLKFLIFIYKRPQVELAEAVLTQLDERVKSFEEHSYFTTKMAKRSRRILHLYIWLYLLIWVTAALAFLAQKERELLYPAWFPFDWRTSTINFVISNFYQMFGIFFSLITNYAGDCYPPLMLCFLAGHIRLLSMRVSKIGQKKWSTRMGDEQELRACILDQNNLYGLFYMVEDVISWPMFLQIVCTAFNTCTAVAALLFFTNSLAERCHYVFYSAALMLQIFPCCYYGTEVEVMFESLHHSAYESNWLKQSLKYKKSMILFTERSIKTTTPVAAKIMPLHLSTLFAVCKIAYSTFAFILQMRQ